MAVHKIDEGQFGVLGFGLDSEDDVNSLPQKGIQTSSSALLSSEGSLRLWFFRITNQVTGEGIWEEV